MITLCGYRRRQICLLLVLLFLSLVLLFQSSKTVDRKTMLGNAFTQNILELNRSLADDCHRMTEASTVAPLRDIHLVMVGDSLMRYQYLSLVYRLRHGVWFNVSQWRYNLVNEKTFSNPFHDFQWGEFLFQTNGILHPYEVCDCYRVLNDIFENRYYYDPRFNNSVVFLLVFGHHYPLVGRLKPHEIRNQSEEWQLHAFREVKDKNSSWKYHDWSNLIRHHVRHLDPQPRHIILNTGLWLHTFAWAKPPTWNESGEVSTPTANLLETIKDTPEYHYAWRTTTYTKSREYVTNSTDQFMCQHLQTCINVSFTKFVSRELYWDMFHFHEPYYRLVNEDMLDQFGYLPDNYLRGNRSEILV